MNKSSKRRIGPLLSLSAGLVGIVVLELVAGPFFVPDAPQESSTAVGDLAAMDGTMRPAEQPTISAFAEIVTRPLFMPSRRPQSATPDTKTAVTGPRSDTFDLVGVMISANRRMALLRSRSTREVSLVIEGQKIAGWEVRTIKPTAVIIGQGDDSELIKLNDPNKKPAVSPSPSAKTTLPAEESPQTP